jgi:hypothetical protein
LSSSKANQTGIEIARPDFQPVTVMLISRYRERRSFRASFRVSLLPIQKSSYFRHGIFVADLFPRIPIRILLLPTHADLAIDQFL